MQKISPSAGKEATHKNICKSLRLEVSVSYSQRLPRTQYDIEGISHQGEIKQAKWNASIEELSKLQLTAILNRL